MTTAPRIHEAVKEAAAKVINRRWCSHHQGAATTDAGSFVTRNKCRRWVCFKCQTAAARHTPR